jgi:phage FluMu gp28-like protein
MGSVIQLLDWQQRYIADRNRFRFLAASVQSGKSFVASLKHTLRRLEKRGLSILLSASDRQSKELMEKVKMHAGAAATVLPPEFFEGTSIVQHTATFANGSRIIALPANPDTARGYSGDVLLDEFAIHRDARAIWAAMFGRVTRGYELDVLSSFKGTDNKFYELAKMLNLVAPCERWRPPEMPVRVGEWTGHWVDIWTARDQGLKVNIEQLRAALGDEEIFLQEYCNIPMASASEFIPLELVLACESGDASIEFDGQGGELYAGMDIGRKKDLSAIWLLERLEDKLLTRGVITLDRVPFAEQKKTAAAIAPLVGRFCVDSTGIGAMLAEELHREFPWVEAIQFTAPVKERLAVEAKRTIEERVVLLPESPKIRRAFQAIKRYAGVTGQVRFDAARTDQGHADEFWAFALANAAASQKAYVPASEGGLVGDTVMGNAMEMTF